MVLSRKVPSKIIIGTGCLIGPNVILTCAHNVFQVKTKKYHTGIEFIPAPIARELNSREYAGKGFKVREIIVPEQYRKMDDYFLDEINRGYFFDIAVLILETELNLEEYFGSFSYNFDWEESPWVKSIQIMKDL
jgi:hypothetical protein